jgi:hypothetical protein
MTPEEQRAQLEAELARCRAERDELSAALETAQAERAQALRQGLRWDRMLLKLQADLDEAEHERDRLYGELQSVISSRSWLLTRPLRGLLGSDRPEAPGP